MDTQFLDAQRLPNSSGLGILTYSELAWRGKRQNIPFLMLISTRTMGTCILGLLAAFFRWFTHLRFGLGRGPITPPGPAVVSMDRKDLNKIKKERSV